MLQQFHEEGIDSLCKGPVAKREHGTHKKSKEDMNGWDTVIQEESDAK